MRTPFLLILRRLFPGVVLLAVCAAPSLRAQSERYAEAAWILSAQDTSLVLDTVRLERIRSGLERARASFAVLRQIQLGGWGGALLLANPSPGPAADTLLRAIGGAGATLSPDRAVQITSTGLRRLDALNARYGATAVRVGVRRNGGLGIGMAVDFARPMNIPRLEKIYEAAGYFTLRWDRYVAMHPALAIRWQPGAQADVFEFEYDRGCGDRSCPPGAHLRVRVPHDGSAPEGLPPAASDGR